MKNSVLLGSSLAILGSITLMLSSCKDDEPPAKPIVSFAKGTKTVPESVGTVTVEVQLDKPAPKALTIEYSVDGTATDIEQAANAAASDFNITGGTGELEIAAGQSSGTIEINITPDNVFETDETIVLTLDDVGTDATLATDEDDRTVTITIGNDDDKAVATITTADMTISEDDYDDFIEIEVQVSQAVSENTTIKYELSGTAFDSLFVSERGGPANYFDYFVNSDDATGDANGNTTGQVTIKPGQTKATIQLQILPDYNLEDDETIIVTLVDGGSSANIGDDNSVTINLKQQNGEFIVLLGDATDADLDLFIWVKDQNGDYQYYTGSALPNEDGEGSAELTFIPSKFTDGKNAEFGASYTYYDGTADTVYFEAHYGKFIDGEVEPDANWNIFTDTLTNENINKYDEEGAPAPAIVQTFTLTNGVYGNFSDIVVQTGTSRVKPLTPAKISKPLRRRVPGSLLMNQKHWNF